MDQNSDAVNDNPENTDTSEQKKPSHVPETLRIGELLVKEGFVKEEELQTALSIQREEKELSTFPLGRILVKMGKLTDSDLNQILDHPDLKKNIGSIALEKGLISQEKLDVCLRKKAPGQLIGDVFLKEGALNHKEMQTLITEQLNTPRLGELALQLNLIDEPTLKRAIKIQGSPRVLGEILSDMKVINPLDLHYVLKKYKKQLKLGEVLVSLGHIEKEALNKVLQEQKYSSESLGNLLVRKQLITTKQLQEALSKQSNIPFKDLKNFGYHGDEKKRLSGIISQKYAEKNLILPLSLVDKELTLAILAPEKLYTARELKALYNSLTITCVLITEEKFSELFEVLYSKQLGALRPKEEEEVEEVEDEPVDDFMQIELDEEMDSGDEEAPVYDAQDIEAEELVNFIIKYGISNGASDIHIEQDRDGVKLRYRIDGVLTTINIGWLRKKLQEKAGSIISRIKIISNLDIAERRLPQDGVFRINYYDKVKGEKTDLDFRVATCKAITGENVTIRILDSRKANVGLDNLNHSPHVLEPFKQLIRSSAGMILVTGPTGSGKSSTLYGALKHIYNPTIKIITAEDPIEYSFPGIMQTQINTKINLTFARLLRSFLRLDPDVILVGEIRDEETAKIGLDAAQTGHLVLSTLHTNDSVSSIPRLFDLDVERGQIASCVTCVLAQRLVRRICPSCRQEYAPEDEEWYPLFDHYPSHLKFYKGKGCETCGFTGYKGRTLLSEVFVVDKEISKALTNGADIDEIKFMAIESGMKTMLDDGLLKLRDTTLGEIIRVIPHDMIETFRLKNRGDRKTHVSAEKSEDSGFYLANPKMEQEIIDHMHEKYENLVLQTDNRNAKIDRSVFGDFIAESYADVCKGYRCNQVIFSIENKNNKVEVSVIPGN